MAKRTETITLEGNSYTIHPFNIGELEELSDLLNGGATTKTSLGIIKLALKRAEPKVVDASSIEPTREEIEGALVTITKLAGLEKAAANPPVAPGAA